jgi:xanthine dehydrogenase accessory factor
MNTSGNSVCDPVRALLGAPENAVLAIVAGTRGPSYRPVGAMMTVFDEAERTGSLSSGCIEADIALQAARVRKTGRPAIIRYGDKSPYVDIQLPCGGALDILLLPHPNRQVLAELVREHDARRPCTLVVDVNSGALSLSASGSTGREGDRLQVRIEPEVLFQVFGKGPEATTFASLVRSAGYPAVLLSPDAETLEAVSAAGCTTHHLARAAYPAHLDTDHRTAIVLFFHDHDWEPPILAGALQTPAFYIGAQGSQRARDARLETLASMGVGADARDRLHGPVGLIPSARDPSTLAVSVLAEVLAEAMAGPS